MAPCLSQSLETKCRRRSECEVHGKEKCVSRLNVDRCKYLGVVNLKCGEWDVMWSLADIG